ncbi:MAG TPA: hypothetical protein PKN48_00640 [Bacteroidales bacterium]|nr:hypothetical protein [Bacteroidales bacterium]
MIPEILNTIRKTLGATTTGRLLSETKNLYRTKGLQDALGNLQKHQTVGRIIAKGQQSFATDLAKQTEGTNIVGRLARAGLGNFAATAKVISKDVPGSGAKAPLIAGKNLFNLFGQHLRAATKVTKDVKDLDLKLLMKNRGGYYYKGKKVQGVSTLSGESSRSVLDEMIAKRVNPGTPGFNRKLVMEASAPGKAWGVATSAPAFGAMVMLQDKQDPLPKRIGKGALEATAWTVAPGFTMAGQAGAGIINYVKNKKKLMEGSNNGLY